MQYYWQPTRRISLGDEWLNALEEDIQKYANH